MAGASAAASARCPRLAVIDAQNFLWAATRTVYGGADGRLHFPASVRALCDAVAALRAAGVEPLCFFPPHWLRLRPGGRGADTVMGEHALAPGMAPDASPEMGAGEQAALRGLLASGAAIEVPSGGRDDLFILTYAFERNGWVISNDRFRDHAAAVARAAAASTEGAGAAAGGTMDVDGEDPAAARERLAWLRTRVLSFALRPPPPQGGAWELVLNPELAGPLLRP